MLSSILEPLPGIHVIQATSMSDNRGSFVKTYEKDIYTSLGIDFNPVEEFYSSSHKNVIRGIHFQIPPRAHDKLVYCIKGRVLDVMIDLRKKSSTFGQVYSHELSEVNNQLIYIPSGFGHGFLSLENDSVMIYKTSSVYSPTHDYGIKWDSIDFDWKISRPIYSERDAQFIDFAEFNSPF